MKNRIALFAAACTLASLSAFAADVEVKDAWARATVPGQQASGAFMTLTSAKGAVLLGGSSPVAKSLEIHEMKHEGDVMKMRAVSRLDLPAGKAVELSGAYHVMLMGLNKELKAGDKVPLMLTIEQNGKQESVSIDAEVRALASGKPASAHHRH
ncbi:MAG TPA: copper chaperone PCu(A)C [Rhodocyclaceae bacterium]|nr:copper chaperone PCu(A)C [Rhodocyclaceae bacterium]